MKGTIITFFNSPWLVALVSLAIAAAVVVTFRIEEGGTSQAPTQTSPDVVADATGKHTTLGFLAGGRVETVVVKPGDNVKAGDVLATLDPGTAAGALTQAKAAYDAAQANYDKVVNGATGPTIDAARAAVNSAEVALEQTTREQTQAVKNAYVALLNVSPAAYPYDNSAQEVVPPTISGSYTLGKEGDIIITTFASGGETGYSFKAAGLVTGGGIAGATTPQPLGDSGLYILFPSGVDSNRKWVVSLPNTKATGYSAALSAYEAAQKAAEQKVATAQAALVQAKSNLAVVAQQARPEDVAAARSQVDNAQGALQMAQANADNRTVRAPEDGTITAVYITTGQIVAQNAAAFELTRAGEATSAQ